MKDTFELADRSGIRLSRRQLLSLAVAGTSTACLPTPVKVATPKIKTSARIVIAGAGIKSPDYPLSRTTDYVAQGVELIAQGVAEIDPDANKAVTRCGTILPYDFLFVATCYGLAGWLKRR